MEIIEKKYQRIESIVPVIVNGKATKRTKKVYEMKAVDVIYAAVEVVIEGHVCYIRKDIAERSTFSCEADALAKVYRADGSNVTAKATIGRTGEKLHSLNILYNVDNKTICVPEIGYSGATGRGWNTYIKAIEW